MKKCLFIVALVLCVLVLYNSKKIFYQINLSYQLYKNLSSTKNGSKYIPKNIYQLVQDKTKINYIFQLNIDYIKKLNPTWNYILYDDNDMIDYIKTNYGFRILNIYNMINPEYGAAKADFFRYLLMYKEGGVYLDIKSGMKYPLDEIISEDDEYILSHWSCKPQKEILGNENGEFQQWHIICRPNHPYLKAVINNVINNILNYDIEKDGVGKPGVLKVTGPIIYTQTIEPILFKYNHKLYKTNEYIGLVYNNLYTTKRVSNSHSHYSLFNSTHYSNLTSPVIIH
jgi:mannosyltransferase OCH1-like enzyme